MKRTFTLLAAAFATTAAAQKPYHRDLAVLEVNREAPRTEFVELFLNGRYEGNYLLGEHVKVSKNRLNADDF